MRTIRRLAPLVLIGLLDVSVSATRAHAQGRMAPAFQPAATPAPAVVLGSYKAPATSTDVALDAAAVERGFVPGLGRCEKNSLTAIASGNHPIPFRTRK